MQFSYKVSEEDYRRALQLRVARGIALNPRKLALFWVFVLICLVLLWTIVQPKSRSGNPSSQPAVTEMEPPSPAANPHPKPMLHALIVNLGPFLLILALWMVMLGKSNSSRPAHLYHRDPAMQGTYTLDVTPAAISMENTSGTSSKSVWNMYEYWREGNGVVILVMRSTAYFIISLAGLSEAQRNELRSILASLLPKK